MIRLFCKRKRILGILVIISMCFRSLNTNDLCRFSYLYVERCQDVKHKRIKNKSLVNNVLYLHHCFCLLIFFGGGLIQQNIFQVAVVHYFELGGDIQFPVLFFFSRCIKSVYLKLIRIKERVFKITSKQPALVRDMLTRYIYRSVIFFVS